jgi:hypothetical protein
MNRMQPADIGFVTFRRSVLLNEIPFLLARTWGEKDTSHIKSGLSFMHQFASQLRCLRNGNVPSLHMLFEKYMLRCCRNEILKICIHWKVNQVFLTILKYSLGQMGFVPNTVWHEARKPEYWSQNRRPLLGYDSANTFRRKRICKQQSSNFRYYWTAL